MGVTHGTCSFPLFEIETQIELNSKSNQNEIVETFVARINFQKYSKNKKQEALTNCHLS